MSPDLEAVYRRKLHDLFQLEFFGMKLGLENIRVILRSLGDPHRTFPSIHIAGTNGKGSVASMLAAIHTASGRKTGLYTSPHLVDFRERIRIDGVMIGERFVLEFLERVWPLVTELNATFFEVTTALAFQYFASEQVDIAIVETGLGGRLDATNVLEHPLASVVTSIGFDHMAQLGPTLESIASEKAGIIKPGSPAIVNCDRSLEWIFLKKASEVGTTVCFVRDFAAETEWTDWAQWSLALAGKHQQENLRTVLATLDVPMSGHALPKRPSEDAIREGLARTLELSGLRGRLEEIVVPELERRGVRVMLDAAHNAPAFERLAEYFISAGVEPIVILGLMQDKAIEDVVAWVRRFARKAIAVAPVSKRALASSELAVRASAAGLDALDGQDVMAGFALASESAGRGDTVLITGSHYVIGDFLKNFQPREPVNRGR